MKRFLTAFAVVGLLAATTAEGALVKWTDLAGGSDHTWSNGANWNTDPSAPASNSDVLIDPSMGASTFPVLNGNYTIGSLTFRDGSSGSPVYLNTNSNTLTVTNALKLDDSNSASVAEIRGGGSIASGSVEITASGSGSITLKVVDSGTVVQTY